MTKTCSSCSTVKPVEDFYRRRSSEDGHHSMCKACMNAKHAEYEAVNRTKINERRNALYAANREAILAKRREERSKDPEAHRAKQRAWYWSDVEKRREENRARGKAGRNAQRTAVNRVQRYGVSADDYNRMLAEQDGKCAICKNALSASKRSGVDHCHETGFIRGLLCGRCNAGIGQLRDDPETVRAALNYLLDARSRYEKQITEKTQ